MKWTCGGCGQSVKYAEEHLIDIGVHTRARGVWRSGNREPVVEGEPAGGAGVVAFG